MSEAGWLEREARAKINLRLKVFPPTRDGFHPLETIFCRISVSDRVRLKFSSEPGIELRILGTVPAPNGRDNLVVQAAELFLGATRRGDGIIIELEKHIPSGSGLGGGSSDAAATLALLNQAAGEPLELVELAAVAAELGSDVPFFIADALTALAWGRGDRLLPGPVLPKRDMIIALPEVSVSTADAYALLDRARAERGGRQEAVTIRSEDLSDWRKIEELATNDFEEVIFETHPEIALLRSQLAETGAALTLLSGSGSALCAVYDDEASRAAALTALTPRVRGARLLSAIGPV